MTKTNSVASINWYSSSANTQHTLSTSAGDDKLLSTARQVLLRLANELFEPMQGNVK